MITTVRLLGVMGLIIGCLVASARPSRRAKTPATADPYQATKLRPVRRVFALPVIVYQPNAPITFQDVQFVATDRGGTASFRIKNISDQPIIACEVAEIHINGGVRTMASPDMGWGGRPLLPGEIRGDFARSDVPLPDAQPIPADEKGTMQTPVFLMVIKASMADGSGFDDAKAYEALEEYCAKQTAVVDLSKPELIFADTK